MTTMLYIITDANTNIQYRLYGHRMECDEALELSVAALGDYDHTVDDLHDEVEVQRVYGRPYESFPELPVK